MSNKQILKDQTQHELSREKLFKLEKQIDCEALLLQTNKQNLISEKHVLTLTSCSINHKNMQLR